MDSLDLDLRDPQRARRVPVSLSRWVNERPPPWDQILTAHDVARLTRRHCWILRTLALMGRFPRQVQFHGRRIGWHRSEVMEWMAHEPIFDKTRRSADPPPARAASRPAHPVALQRSLQLGSACEHKGRHARGPCQSRRWVTDSDKAP